MDSKQKTVKLNKVIVSGEKLLHLYSPMSQITVGFTISAAHNSFCSQTLTVEMEKFPPMEEGWKKPQEERLKKDPSPRTNRGATDVQNNQHDKITIWIIHMT